MHLKPNGCLEPPYGSRTTFSNPGSRPYNRLNHDAPSANGALADNSGSTRIARRDIAVMHAGYSPDDAQDP